MLLRFVIKKMIDLIFHSTNHRVIDLACDQNVSANDRFRQRRRIDFYCEIISSISGIIIPFLSFIWMKTAPFEIAAFNLATFLPFQRKPRISKNVENFKSSPKLFAEKIPHVQILHFCSTFDLFLDKLHVLVVGVFKEPKK